MGPLFFATFAPTAQIPPTTTLLFYVRDLEAVPWDGRPGTQPGLSVSGRGRTKNPHYLPPGEGRFSIVGYDCDGVDWKWEEGEGGRKMVPTGTDGTPSHFAICATAPASWGPEFDEFPELAKQAGLAKEGNATMGWYQSEGGGFVFNAGSTDWVLGLADPAVERITRNVLDAARK